MTRAPPEEISKRRIITARRKGPRSTANSSSLFSGFGGFGSTGGSTNSGLLGLSGKATGGLSSTVSTGNSSGIGSTVAGNPFQFANKNGSSPSSVNNNTLANPSPSKYSRSPLNSAGEPLTTNAGNFGQQYSKSSLLIGGNSSSTVSSSVKRSRAEIRRSHEEGPPPPPEHQSTEKGGRNEPFCQELKALNTSVLSWIQQHVHKDPFIDLNPIFADYTKHLASIERKYAEPESGASGQSKQSGDGIGLSMGAKISFGGSKRESDDKTPEIITVGTPEKVEPKEVEETKDVPKLLFGLPPSSALGAKISINIVVDSSKSKDTVAGSSSAPLFSKPVVTNGGSGQKLGTTTTSSGGNTPVFAFTRSIPDASKDSDTQTSTPTSKPLGTEKNLFGSSAVSGQQKSLFGSSGTGVFGSGGTSSLLGSTGGASLFGTGNTGAAAPFSFGAVSAPTGGATAEDEPYEPPKVDSIEVEEEDAFYKIKCKLFFKQDEQYKEKGLGTLYLKPADSGKTQLLIRAGTALGNVLLNIALSEEMPTSRVGKNNVSLVCVPNPPLDPKGKAETEPRILLIRVKTGEDADDLLEKLTSSKAKK